jgi:adenosylcobinamide-GDP ribazoletransferase
MARAHPDTHISERNATGGGAALLRGFPIAVEFLTVVRLGGRSFDGAAFAAAQAWYPLVGLLLGCAVGLTWLLADAVLPRAPSTALAIVALAALSGGLHLDGLADTADGLFGGRDRESKLAIMRDSHTGSFGAIAIAAVLLLKWSALLSIAAGGAMFAALLLAPVLSRGAVVAAVGRYPYARESGMGARFPEAARGLPTIVALTLAAVIALAVYGPAGIVVAIGATLLAVGLAWYPYTKLGGLTGDIYGALIELIEVAVLLAAASGAQHDWLHPLLWGG